MRREHIMALVCALGLLLLVAACGDTRVDQPVGDVSGRADTSTADAPVDTSDELPAGCHYELQQLTGTNETARVCVCVKEKP